MNLTTSPSENINIYLLMIEIDFTQFSDDQVSF